MNKFLTIALVVSGFATLALNASADPIVRRVKGNTVIILDPVVVVSAPCHVERMMNGGTVTVCPAGVL